MVFCFKKLSLLALLYPYFSFHLAVRMKCVCYFAYKIMWMLEINRLNKFLWISFS